MSSFGLKYYPGGLPNDSFEIEYLSVEYLCEGRREASPVVFNLKCLIDETGETEDWYAVCRVFMEPTIRGPTGCVRVQRLPDVKGEKSGSKDGPRCPLAPDSLAEFYLDLKRRRLTLSKREDMPKLNFIDFCSDLGTFKFYQPDISRPYKYYDSRDFICQVFARLLNAGYLQSSSMIGDTPHGFRSKIETNSQKCPYTKESKVDFPAVISNLFYTNTEDRRTLDRFEKDRHGKDYQRWENPSYVQGVYQPVIKGRFIDANSKSEKKRQVPKNICLPYNQNEAEIDQEGATCAKTIYKGLGLRTPFYWDSLLDETAKTDKNSTTGLQNCTQSAKKQPLLPSATGTPRGSEGVSALSSPVAGAMAMRATASNAGSNRAPNSTSGPAANANPSSRMASARAASSKLPSAGGSAAKEGGSKYTRKVSRVGTTVSEP